MQALILAGGLGTRLRSIVNDRPKPMAKVGGKPFLEYQIEFLKNYHIDQIILCAGYMHQQVKDYFGNGSRYNVQVEYSIEEELLGTGGAIKNAERFIHGTFLTLNGDSFLDVDLDKLVTYHYEQKSCSDYGSYIGTIALTKVHDVQYYGSIKLNRKNLLTSFSEKAANEEFNKSEFVNAGIYVLDPEVLRYIPSSQKVSIEREIFPSLLDGGFSLGGYPAEGVFVDIGTPEGFHKFQVYLEGRKL